MKITWEEIKNLLFLYLELGVAKREKKEEITESRTFFFWFRIQAERFTALLL